MAKWVPSIDNTTEIIGIILLFIPYIIVLLPFLQNKIVKYFQTLYIHNTPRSQWNAAVDQEPPRRLLGYIFSILFTFTAIWLLLINNHYNNYMLDFFQYFLYLSIPLILSIVRPFAHRPCDMFDFLIILLVIIPIEISQEYDGFLPDIKFTIYSSWGTSPNISILTICAFNLFLFIFFIFRPLNNIGLSWDITNNNIKRLGWILLRFFVILCIFLCLAIPFCLIPSIKYLHSASSLSNIWIDGIFKFFCLFFLDLLLKEFLYRGIIQNLLHSAFDFNEESKRYLIGRENSLTHNLNDNNNNNKDKGQETISIDFVNTELLDFGSSQSKLSNNAHCFGADIDEFEDGASSFKSSVSYIPREHDHIQKCLFLRFNKFRDWFIILLSSIIYGFTIIDYKHFDKTKDLIFGFILMTYLGFCCGWIYRLTNSCFISAIFNTLIIFNFKYVFNPNIKFCNGAC